MKTNIVKYITELLYRHDCVIVPGFGGFIGNYSPAAINPVYHTFFPPYKSLLFNIHLKQNDGLLASWISQAEQIPYQDAMELIREMLADWNFKLENGEELIIERVGKIVKESDGIFQFEQDLSINYLPDSFGLSTLVSPAIRRPGIQEKMEKKLDRYIHDPSGRPGKLTRTLKWAAILALPLGVAVYFSITNMDQIRSLHENYSGFLFSNSSHAKTAVKSSKVIHPSVIPENSTQKSTKIQATSNVMVTPATTPVVTKKPDASAKNGHAIIVGAFRFRENADNLVAKLKQEGYDAGIFDITTTGLFRVTVGTYASREEAIAQLAVIRSGSYSSAWLLSK
ncbi:MAG: SPOR domain-containing protein [Bacteroidetes bacterium]|nr:SPOR domain-containing protein [Bacteroidota bacterium]